MVFLSERRPEQGHEPVAGELRRRAAVTVHLRQARLEKGMNEVAHPLVSEPLGEGGRVDDVAKEHGHLFDFAGERAHGPWGLRLRHIGRRGGRLLATLRVDGGAALPTEFVSGRVGSAA